MKTVPMYAINFASFLPGDLEVCLESHREQPEGRVDGCDPGSKVAEYLRLVFQTMVPSSSGQGASDGQMWCQGPWNPAVTLAWSLNAVHHPQEGGGLQRLTYLG